MSLPALLDQPPRSEHVTDYDLAHRITYLRLLDAEADGASWREVVKLVLGVNPEADEHRAQRIHASHLARAKWMTKAGYQDLLERADD